MEQNFKYSYSFDNDVTNDERKDGTGSSGKF